MIHVLIKTQNCELTYLSIKGHAKSAEYGKDLICAAASALITAGLNSLENIDNYEIVFEEGNVLIASNNITKHDQIVLETVINGLTAIEEEYPEYIKIKKEIN